MTSTMKWLLYLLAGLCWTSPSWAVTLGDTSTDPTQTYGTYYTISDSPPRGQVKVQTPFEMLTENFVQAPRVVLSLLRWIKHSRDPQAPAEAYDRKVHFGTWVNDPTDTTCFNTRAKTLIRDSETEVTFKDTNHCVVESGKWQDPYTGDLKTLSSEIQIDHIVPLKHAYLAGAAKWPWMKRCLYANFLGNDYHLLSVDGHENMRKGDRSPDQYLPPDSRYVCTYLANWLRVKLIWNLTMNPVEADAIVQTIQQNNCRPSQVSMTAAELARQRVKTTELQEICQKQVRNP